MKRITKDKAKEILSRVLVQITKMDKNDLDWKTKDVVGGFYLGKGQYRLAVKDDWNGVYYECVRVNTNQKVVFYSSFVSINKKEYFNCDGDMLKPKQLKEISPYLFKSSQN